MDNLKCLRFDHAKSDILKYINWFKYLEYFMISEMDAIIFRLECGVFSIFLLDYAVQMLREQNKHIIWNISFSRMAYGSGNDFHIYNDDQFWKLIANQDVLQLRDFPLFYLKDILEEILQLINGLQLKRIEIIKGISPFDDKEELQEILDRIKEITEAEVIYKDD